MRDSATLALKDALFVLVGVVSDEVDSKLESAVRALEREAVEVPRSKS